MGGPLGGLFVFFHYSISLWPNGGWKENNSLAPLPCAPAHAWDASKGYQTTKIATMVWERSINTQISKFLKIQEKINLHCKLLLSRWLFSWYIRSCVNDFHAVNYSYYLFIFKSTTIIHNISFSADLIHKFKGWFRLWSQWQVFSAPGTKILI